ncbi:phosphonate ABC transporter ATP-binding protein [Algihabitans albus]|uniref:phosphonate ABC transporter ATP-binding protein n=1 Tax=Algihabitans albus TaxID=2164067 RepID=UPI000E5D0E5B|nr:phosphonate ABC transporter ATP-binding protein [Algihabitans albus]
MAAVEIERLTKTFGNLRALDAVDLTIQPGEMVALIGASGSGKSTLIRHMAGLLRGDAGTTKGQVRMLGRTMQSGGRLAPNARRLRAQIGVVFQQFNLVNRLPLLTNVATGVLGRIPVWRGSLGLFTKEEKLRAMRALKRVGMAAFAEQRAGTLSGGQQQRAAIARCLVQQARIVLADEPIASLDPASARKVMQMLADINREDGITVLVSLHQVDYAIRFCTRAIAMRDGRVVYDGATERLTPDFLKDLYGTSREELILTGAFGNQNAPGAELEEAEAGAGPTGELLDVRREAKAS